VLLYDADRIKEAASAANEQDLYEAQLGIFLDPNDESVQRQARLDGIPDAWLEAARRSPVYKMAMKWKIAFPLHPEYRTLPMVWYVPPLSPVQAAAEAGKLGMNGIIPDFESLKIPVRYLANLLTAGKEEPVRAALKKMLAMRAYMRRLNVEGEIDETVLAAAGSTESEIREMYRYLALAAYEDRFVIPTTHRELVENAYELRGGCGFSFGDGCAIPGRMSKKQAAATAGSVPVTRGNLFTRNEGSPATAPRVQSSPTAAGRERQP